MTGSRSAVLGALILASSIRAFAACGPTYGADGIAVDRSGHVWLTHYEDNRIGRLDPNNGTFTEFLADRSANAAVTARDTWNADEGFDYGFDFGLQGIGLDEAHGALWSVRFNTDRALRFALTGHTFQTFTLPGRVISSRGSLPIDSLGNVWLATGLPTRSSYQDGKLVRLSAQGEQRIFALPEQAVAGLALALDAESRPWIALNPPSGAGDAAIYLLDNGRFVEQAISDMGSTVPSMAFDVRGRLWFAATQRNALGKHEGGATQYYPLPTSNAYPGALTADERGGVWFTEWYGHRLGHAAPDGNIKEFSMPAEEESPVALVPDRQNHVWFSALLNYNLFRLETDSGHIREYPVPVPANWSKDAAEGLTACVIKPRDVTTEKPGEKIAGKAADGTETKAQDSPLRHPKAYGDEKGAEMFERHCHSACHTWYRVDKVAGRRSDWAPTVDRMTEFNRAGIDTTQRDLIVDYLNRYYTMPK